MRALRVHGRFLVAVLGMLGGACSSQQGGNTDDGKTTTPAEVLACRATIAAKTEEVKAAGIDIDNWSIADAAEMAELTTTEPQTQNNYTQFDGHYRSLANHPGCSVTNLYYDKANKTGTTPYKDGNNDGKWTGSTALGGPNMATNFIDGDKANIPGYPCAAKEYAQPDEDTSKPIVILVHGNSTRPHTWEKFLLPSGVTISSSENVQITPDTAARDQLAEKLIAQRYRVIAVDFRTDLVTSLDPTSNNTNYNAAGNIDHGWATPILQSLLKAMIRNYPDRKLAIISHSMGVTVTRDALRRLYVEHLRGADDGVNPYPHVSHVILGSGANHGVSTYDPPNALCDNNKTMRGTVVCEMGSRSNFKETYFSKPLNGPRDLFATPCADGDYAYGKTGQCDGNVVKYFTITMTDITKGTNYQDAYVSESASRMNMEGCVTNRLNTLDDYDKSGYFVKGLIANHFGSMRSEAGLTLVLDYLAQ